MKNKCRLIEGLTFAPPFVSMQSPYSIVADSRQDSNPAGKPLFPFNFSCLDKETILEKWAFRTPYSDRSGHETTSSYINCFINNQRLTNTFVRLTLFSVGTLLAYKRNHIRRFCCAQ